MTCRTCITLWNPKRGRMPNKLSDCCVTLLGKILTTNRLLRFWLRRKPCTHSISSASQTRRNIWRDCCVTIFMELLQRYAPWQKPHNRKVAAVLFLSQALHSLDFLCIPLWRWWQKQAEKRLMVLFGTTNWVFSYQTVSSWRLIDKHSNSCLTSQLFQGKTMWFV